MKLVPKTVLLFVLVLVFGFAQSQQVYYYYVQFTDKKNNPYAINRPEDFLSQRAIDRRVAHNIPVVENDLPVTPEYLQGVAAKGVTLLNPTKWLNGVTIKTADSTLADSVLKLSYVSSIREIKTDTTSKKDFFKHESFSKNPPADLKSTASGKVDIYGYAYTQISQINGIPLHQDGFKGQGMVIAQLDAGYLNVPQQVLFDSLRADGRLLGTRDFVHPGSTSVYNESEHGRMVLSCMAANDKGVMVGTAPDAAYWLLRTEDVASESVLEEYNWVSGAEFADSVGADIINSSLGYTAFDNPADSYSYGDINGKTAVSTRGAEIAATKGMLVVNSAGNSGTDLNFPWIGAPADGDSVFTIGAVTSSGTRANFSSIGPTADDRIKPTVMAMGQAATIANATNGILYGNGTSFSSPIIAGMSACLWEAHPQANNMQVIAVLKATASLHNNPNDMMGWGIPNFAKADSMLTVLTGITSNSPALHEWKIFPNPVKNQFTLVLNTDGRSKILTVTVYNLLGQQVAERSYDVAGTSHRYVVNNLGRLPKGIYLVTAVSGSTNIIAKIIKQ